MNGKPKNEAFRADRRAGHAAEFQAFWEAWERLFGPPALESLRGRLVVRSPGQAPLRLPDVGQQVAYGGRRALVLEVFRTAAAAEADGEGPPYGWRVRVLLEGGRVASCKPRGGAVPLKLNCTGRSGLVEELFAPHVR